MLIKAEVSRREPRTYALTSAGREVGALRAGTLILRGYDSLAAARAAADVAAARLVDWYQERWGTALLMPLDEYVDAELAVYAGETVVGRLLRPGDDDGCTSSYGVELRIPDHLWVATGLGLAQRIYTALNEQVAT